MSTSTYKPAGETDFGSTSKPPFGEDSREHSSVGICVRDTRPQTFCEHSSPSTDDVLVNVLCKRDQRTLLVLIAGWLLGVVFFYLWWFDGDHVAGPFKFALNTLLVTWTSVVPAYLLFFVVQMKRVNPQLAIPQTWRVAMVTTRAPSEPFEVVQETLLAMLDQTYPHDTWLADEDPSDDILQWCADRGIQVSTRRDSPEYHQQT